jgi:predicted HicB family RNase H-like nuclease
MKPSRLTFEIDKETKDAAVAMAAMQDLSLSQFIRRAIRIATEASKLDAHKPQRLSPPPAR